MSILIKVIVRWCVASLPVSQSKNARSGGWNRCVVLEKWLHICIPIHFRKSFQPPSLKGHKRNVWPVDRWLAITREDNICAQFESDFNSFIPSLLGSPDWVRTLLLILTLPTIVFQCVVIDVSSPKGLVGNSRGMWSVKKQIWGHWRANLKFDIPRCEGKPLNLTWLKSSSTTVHKFYDYAFALPAFTRGWALSIRFAFSFHQCSYPGLVPYCAASKQFNQLVITCPEILTQSCHISSFRFYCATFGFFYLCDYPNQVF